MAQIKTKRSFGAHPRLRNLSVRENESHGVATTDSLAIFDDTALASLAQKIEQKLQGQNVTTKGTEKSSQKPLITPQGNGEEYSKKTGEKRNPKKGKKRNRDGDVIEAEDRNARPKRLKDGMSIDDNILRQEVLQLGGDQADYDLIKGLDSQSEVEYHPSTKAKSKGLLKEGILRKELSKILNDSERPNSKHIREEDLGMDDVEEDTPALAPSLEEIKSTTKGKVIDDTTPLGNDIRVAPKESSRLVIPPRSDWYNTALPHISASKQTAGIPHHLLNPIRQYAKSLLEKENQMYSKILQASSSSSHKFYSTIMASGTLSDKISALTLAAQESPLHNVKALDNLIGLAKKRSRAQAVEVLRSLKDMFGQGTLLPSDRKLKVFGNNPSLVAAFEGPGSKWVEGKPLPGGLQPSHLILWVFEDYIKEVYFEMLKILEVWCNDEIEFSRSKALSYVYELLKEKPEQEANLLRLLVNKLGDPGRKIASRASYLLLQLQLAHPMMKSTVITTIEELLFRPGQSFHAKYYAAITLNQTILSSKEEKVAVQLLDIYFSLFIILLKPIKGEGIQGGAKDTKSRRGKKTGSQAAEAKEREHDKQLGEKLISAVLTGANRAYPFTSSDTERLSKHIDTLFRITHSSNFNTSVQALILIQQLAVTRQVSADRFYRVLYESLLDPRLPASSKHGLYLNLLYKALKNDLNTKRVKAFIKRIVQILGLHQPSFVCGVFFLIHGLEKSSSGLQTLVDQPQADESDEGEIFRDVPDEGNGQQKGANDALEPERQKSTNGYDPRKRDPQHCNADKSCLWELIPYLYHFHPSVSVSADNLLNHTPLAGKPDLTLHTLIHFLDRFVYRNPKTSAALRGSSFMQPLAGSESTDLLFVAGDRGKAQEPLNVESFWHRRAEDVSAEEVFFHQYFNRLGKEKPKKKKNLPQGGKEADHDESEDESEIWNALVESRPDLEGDESDIDLDMDDLNSEFSEEEEVEGSSEDDEDLLFNKKSIQIGETYSSERDEDMKAGGSKEQPSDDDGNRLEMDILDEEAFRDSDEELPSDLDVGADIDVPQSTDDPTGKVASKKKRKLKHLPTFASVEDYAALLDGEDEGQ